LKLHPWLNISSLRLPRVPNNSRFTSTSTWRLSRKRSLQSRYHCSLQTYDTLTIHYFIK